MQGCCPLGIWSKLEAVAFPSAYSGFHKNYTRTNKRLNDVCVWKFDFVTGPMGWGDFSPSDAPELKRTVSENVHSTRV